MLVYKVIILYGDNKFLNHWNTTTGSPSLALGMDSDIRSLFVALISAV
jgi:hypothetical protein